MGCLLEDDDRCYDRDEGVRNDDEEEDEPRLQEDVRIFHDAHSDGHEADGHDEEESVGGCFDGLVEEVPQGEQLGGGRIVVGETLQLGLEREEEEDGERKRDGDGRQREVQDGVEHFGDDDAEREGSATDEDGYCFAGGSVGDTAEDWE